MEHGEVTHISGKWNSGSYLPSLVPAVDSNLASFAVMLAAPSLGKFLSASAQFTYVVESVIGPTGNVIVTVRILVAIFAAVQAIILIDARILYATGATGRGPRAPITRSPGSATGMVARG